LLKKISPVVSLWQALYPMTRIAQPKDESPKEAKNLVWARASAVVLPYFLVTA